MSRIHLAHTVHFRRTDALRAAVGRCEVLSVGEREGTRLERAIVAKAGREAPQHAQLLSSDERSAALVGRAGQRGFVGGLLAGAHVHRRAVERHGADVVDAVRGRHLEDLHDEAVVDGLPVVVIVVVGRLLAAVHLLGDEAREEVEVQAVRHEHVVVGVRGERQHHHRLLLEGLGVDHGHLRLPGLGARLRQLRRGVEQLAGREGEAPARVADAVGRILVGNAAAHGVVRPGTELGEAIRRRVDVQMVSIGSHCTEQEAAVIVLLTLAEARHAHRH